MSDELKSLQRKLSGPDSTEQHILLLKLTDLLENPPYFGEKCNLDADQPPRKWLAKARALLQRLDSIKTIEFDATFRMLSQHWSWGINNIKGQIQNSTEELLLALELEGRSDIGLAFEPGDTYKFFSALKKIVEDAEEAVWIIDPYFDGEAFDNYLSGASASLNIRILADRYSKDVSVYVRKHAEQFSSVIELASSKELHDRVIIIDERDVWIMGASIKDAGKKATYLIPLHGDISSDKIDTYQQIWSRAKRIE